MASICKILRVNHQMYEDMVLEMFFEWCWHYASSIAEYQKFMINRPLLKWYLQQLPVYEHTFKKEIEAYKTADITEVHRHYHRVTIKINDNYPMPLIKQARKTVITLTEN